VILRLLCFTVTKATVIHVHFHGNNKGVIVIWLIGLGIVLEEPNTFLWL